MDPKAALIYKATLAEQAERYEDMVEEMRKVATMSERDLEISERNQLSVAYKNVIGGKRASWRVLCGLLEKVENSGETSQTGWIKEMTEVVQNEISEVCNGILSLLDDHLIPNATADESKVFYYKMKGDYHRYMAEFKKGDEQNEIAELSLKAYKSAGELADGTLEATNAIRLGLALNYSVFYYEILKNPQRACNIAKAAFDEAISQLDELSESSYKDSTLIMQLLRDNLTLWTNDMDSESNRDEDLVTEDLEES